MMCVVRETVGKNEHEQQKAFQHEKNGKNDLLIIVMFIFCSCFFPLVGELSARGSEQVGKYESCKKKKDHNHYHEPSGHPFILSNCLVRIVYTLDLVV